MARKLPGRAAGDTPRVTIAHDFAETYGGAERVVATIAELFPDAPVWVIAGRGSVAERMGVADRFHTLLPEGESFFRHYRILAPVYPGIVRFRALPAADVLLTSSYAFANAFRTRNRAPQVCYCHSPLRFAWSMTGEYAERWTGGPARRGAFRILSAAMRAQDRRAAGRVDRYLANSRHVAEMIRRSYGREAAVVYPPIDCDLFRPSAEPGHDEYYLFCGRLIEPYKRPGIVIDAFRSFPHRLVVAGDGPAYRELKERASANVEFVGHVDDADLVPLMQRCAANVLPSVDDFGMIPVETMACGRPVLAIAAGGALETIVAGKTGAFFREPTAIGLLAALEEFDPDSYDRATIRAHAEQWGLPRFNEAIHRAITEAVRA